MIKQFGVSLIAAIRRPAPRSPIATTAMDWGPARNHCCNRPAPVRDRGRNRGRSSTMSPFWRLPSFITMSEAMRSASRGCGRLFLDPPVLLRSCRPSELGHRQQRYQGKSFHDKQVQNPRSSMTLSSWPWANGKKWSVEKYTPRLSAPASTNKKPPWKGRLFLRFYRTIVKQGETRE